MRWIGAGVLGLALTLSTTAPVSAPAEAASRLEGRVVDRTLANGLRILVVERRAVPTISLNVTFRVGSVDERSGESGLAHLFEHMAFKGTTTIGTKDAEREQVLLDQLDRLMLAIQQEEARGVKADAARLATLRQEFAALQEEARTFVVPNEIGAIYDRQGAVGFNASTGVDLTRYVVSVPANRLPLWIALEYDRMTRPVFREFYTERDVVLEERRMRVDNNPMGKLYEAFIATAFAAHSYATPTIGWPSDLNQLTAPMAREFFRRYYGPGNAVVVIVGDVAAEAAINDVAAVFGRIPAAPAPPPVWTEEPPQEGERRVDVEFDAQPHLVIGYHKPDIHDPDDPVFDVIESLLSSGRTSRLYTELVVKRQVAVAASASSGDPGVRYPTLFTLEATPRAPHTLDEVEAALLGEVERLQRESVSARELEKVVNRVNADLTRSLQSNAGLASQLAYFETVAGDWRYVLGIGERMAKVTPEDIRRVASAWFVPRNRTVARLIKPTVQEAAR